MTRRTNRLICMLLSLVLCVQLLPAAVFAAETVAGGTSGAAAWSLDADGTFTISGGEMDNYASAAEQPWAEYVQQIKKVVIGNGVTRVGDHAFDGCSNLLEIEFGSDVYTIGKFAFANTTNLTEAKMPKNVKVFCDGMFHKSGIKKLYVYSRYTEFEDFYSIGSDEDNVLPLDTVIYCYDCSHAYFYFNRPTVIMTDDLVIDVNNGDGAIAMGIHHPDYVRDIWSASKTQDALVFNSNFFINTDDALRIHNEMVEEGKKIGPDYHNNGKLEVEVRLDLQNYQGNGIRTIWGGATYSFFEYNLEYEPNENYAQWDCWSNEEQILTVTPGTNGITVNINTDMQELAALADEQVSNIFIYVSIKGISHKYNGRYESVNKTTTIESCGASIYDAHLRQSDIDWGEDRTGMMTLNQELTVIDWAPDWGMTAQEYAKYYEPVGRKYTWYYRIGREGHFYNEETGEDIYPGMGFWDLSEGMFTETYNGVLYGGVAGTYDAGSDATVSLEKILPAEQLAFVETLRGVKARGMGGEATIELGYTLTVTYADGSEVMLEGRVADETTEIAGICLHTCKVCGLCTSEDLLACNSRYGYRINACTCETPSPAIVSSAVNNAQIVDSQVWCGDVTARVETFDVETAVTTEYFKAITKNTGSHNVLAVYDITLYNGDGYPYTINEWGGTEEYVTLTIPVSAEVIAAAEEGLLEMYHVDKNGIADLVAITVDAENSTITFTGYNFSPYILKKGGSTPGDIDGNETVDVDDVLALLWYVLFPDDYPIDAEADFDHNGSTDVDDVLTLLWYVLFPDDYPL